MAYSDFYDKHNNYFRVHYFITDRFDKGYLYLVAWFIAMRKVLEKLLIMENIGHLLLWSIYSDLVEIHYV